MSRRTRGLKVLALLCGLTCGLTAVGCQDGKTNAAKSPNNTADPHAGHDHAGHDHAAEGPHQGHIIELGSDSLHAEWTHDDKTGEVTVYLLGADVKTPMPIGAEHITITVQLPNQPMREYQLTAKRTDGQSGSPTNEFSIVDPAMLTALKIGDAVDAFLVVKDGDMTLRGKIEHHDHSGHQH